MESTQESIPLFSVAQTPVYGNQYTLPILGVEVALATLIAQRLRPGWSLPWQVVTGLVLVGARIQTEVCHQGGHAWVAQRAGAPMEYFVWRGFFMAPHYPQDSASLSPTVHMLRALGGPPVSVVIGVLLLPFSLALRGQQGLVALGLHVVAWMNLLAGAGSLMPLRVFDGGSLIRWGTTAVTGDQARGRAVARQVERLFLVASGVALGLAMLVRWFLSRRSQ